MRRRRREMENCEPLVEEFLKENPRFSATDGWFLTWCRMGNGGDPPYHKGPFREDQLYLNFGEFVTVYPQAGLEIMTAPGADISDLYYAVLWGALVALKKSDDQDPGWLYYEGKWLRIGQNSAAASEEVQVNEDPITELARLEVKVDEEPDSDYLEMYFHVDTDDGETVVTICPTKFFKEDGCCADSAFQPEFDAAMKGIEDQFEELTDATYGFEGSEEDARKILLAHGFKQDATFDAFMKK